MKVEGKIIDVTLKKTSTGTNIFEHQEDKT
jgi:hypothetical protein